MIDLKNGEYGQSQSEMTVTSDDDGWMMMSTNGYETVPPCLSTDPDRQVIGRSRRVQHVSAKNDVNAIDGPEDESVVTEVRKDYQRVKSFESTLSWDKMSYMQWLV
jgi:hypothetical protein